MKLQWKEAINFLLRGMGIQFTQYPMKDQVRRSRLIKNAGIQTLFDVGAANGEYALEMRVLGFTGVIHSFEPVRSEFQKLEKVSEKDNNWKVYPIAIGPEKGTFDINVAKNRKSSSLLTMNEIHEDADPNSVFIRKEKIRVETLDRQLHHLKPSLIENLMLKLDVQGVEMTIIQSLENIRRFKIIQLEMSLKPLYEGESDFWSVSQYLRDGGFRLVSLENGFCNMQSGELLQVDGVFLREE